MVAPNTAIEPRILSRRQLDPVLLGIPQNSDRRPARRPKHVLLVEEEPSVRRHLAGVLRAAGYVVEETGTGAEAVRSASGFAADLVVSEMSLRDTTGPRLVAVLRHSSLPGVAALFISWQPREYAEDAALLPTGAEFLAKPFGPGRLREAVGRLVG